MIGRKKPHEGKKGAKKQVITKTSKGRTAHSIRMKNNIRARIMAAIPVIIACEISLTFILP
jgi:hypothetical protein